MHTRLFSLAAICAISMAGHPMFAAETGGGGGKAKDTAKAPDPDPKTALEQANATHETIDGATGAALDPAAPPPAPDGKGAPFLDIDLANARVLELEDELAALKASSENEAATLRAELTALDRAHDDLKAKMVAGTLTTTQRDQAEDQLGDDLYLSPDDELVEVRVKTPMLINPSVPHDYDAAKHGLIPAAFPLARGLNMVPRHIADHWMVKANADES